MRSSEFSRVQRGQAQTGTFFFRPGRITPGWLRVYASVLAFILIFQTAIYFLCIPYSETETSRRYLTRTLSRLPPLEFPKFARENISPLNCGMIITS